METLGGIGPGGQQLIKALAKQVTDTSATHFIQHLRSKISVALVIGNANSLLLSMQKVHMLQLEHRETQSLRKAYGTRVHQPPPLNPDHLEKALQRSVTLHSRPTDAREASALSPTVTVAIDFGECVDSADVCSLAAACA